MVNKFFAGAILCAAVLIGCGSNKNVSIDVFALGNDLDTKIEYQDDLEQITTDMAAMFLDLSDIDIVNSAIYEGAGGTAEEIAVIECANADEAEKAEEILKNRVEEQKDSFADYVPGELVKLDAAVIRVVGNYAILSVSDDPKTANDIIDGYVK